MAAWEDALARHRIMCTTALVVLGQGAWVYLIAGAGLSTVPVADTASMRHPSGMAMAGMAMTTSAAEKLLPLSRKLSGVIGQPRRVGDCFCWQVGTTLAR